MRKSERKQRKKRLREKKLYWILLPETFVKMNRDGCISSKIELFRHRLINLGQDWKSDSCVCLPFL